MAFTTFTTTSTQQPTLFGRGGYNGPASNSESDDESRSIPSINYGRGGYNKGPDDDEEEDGRGGYN